MKCMILKISFIDPETPFDIKLRLVKIFRHMHQDIGMARQVCLSFQSHKKEGHQADNCVLYFLGKISLFKVTR